MRILIYGAGVIGSLYAAYLARAGCSVSVLARGRRLEELQASGLLYRRKGAVRRADVTVMEHLAPGDVYDYIFLTVRADQLHPALRSLCANKSPTIVTMVNSPEPYEAWESLCGQGRILPAFPGAGGGFSGSILDAALTPRLLQPTVFGEIGGLKTERSRRLESLFRKAGISCRIVPDMHAWQLCHLALVIPLANAYYQTAGAPCEVWRDKSEMRRTAEALCRNFRALSRAGCAITPHKLRLFLRCPAALPAAVLPFVYRSRFGDRFMYRHSQKAKGEMEALRRDFEDFLLSSLK